MASRQRAGCVGRTARHLTAQRPNIRLITDMSVIQLIHTAHRADQPLVCFLDLQIEYVAEGRALALESQSPWMANCRRLLALARAERLSIAHFRQLRRGTVLNPATEFAS